jgi:hypothetical protein
MLRVPVHEPAALSQPDRSALTAEIQRVLAALSEVEACYESDQDCLKGWSGPEAIRGTSSSILTLAMLRRGSLSFSVLPNCISRSPRRRCSSACAVLSTKVPRSAIPLGKARPSRG